MFRQKFAELLFLLAIILIILSLISSGCSEGKKDYAGVVSAGSPEAVSAGLEILRNSGNAVDASIAVAFALGVTEPAQSGLGGQAQFLIYQPGKEPVIINGTSFSPSNLQENISKKDLVKHKATTIPSMVKVLGYLWENYSAELDWNELLEPSIKFAESGFSLTEFRHKVLEIEQNELREDSITAKLFLGSKGTLINGGAIWKQPVLVKTLKQLAENGSEDFYRGLIAQKIVDDMKLNNGWITINDLKNFPQPFKQKPLKGTYRGYEIYTMPPPGGGWVIIQALNILEQYPSEELDLNSTKRLQYIAQSLHIAHSSRRDEPVEDLINYQRDVNLKTDKNYAKKLSDNYSNGETTHFSVVDKNGMVVSATLSINNYFGSKSASPELGFLYNDYMNEFKINEPEHPFNLRPDAMPYSSMTPTILMKEGKPVVAIGSPGSERIISAIVQIMSLWIDAGLNIEDAVAQPRIHVTPEKVIYLESNDVNQNEISNLKEIGFSFQSPPSEIIINKLNPYFGGVNAVAFENNEWKGAADPRRDGAVGYKIK